MIEYEEKFSIPKNTNVARHYNLYPTKNGGVNDTTKNQELLPLTITIKKNLHKINNGSIVTKLLLKDLENSRVYNTIFHIVLTYKKVNTNLNNTLKNTERKNVGRYYCLRKFPKQSKILNEIPTISSGIIRPFNIKNITIIT